jgi:hypothetical protein
MQVKRGETVKQMILYEMKREEHSERVKNFGGCRISSMDTCCATRWLLNWEIGR